MYNKNIDHSSGLNNAFTAFRGRSSHFMGNTRNVWPFVSIELIDNIIAEIEQDRSAVKQIAPFTWSHFDRINSEIFDSTKWSSSFFIILFTSSFFYSLFWSVYLFKSLSVAITTNHVSLNFPHKDLSLFNWWYLSIPQIVLIIFGLDIRLCLHLNIHIPHYSTVTEWF